MPFNDPVKEAFWKHCGKKEKMLVTSIFSFSHHAFYPFLNKFKILSHILLLSANAFNLDQSKILSFSKYLIAFSKFKAFADNNFNVDQKEELLSDKVENIVWRGENAGYQHFLLFPLFQKAPSLCS